MDIRFQIVVMMASFRPGLADSCLTAYSRVSTVTVQCDLFTDQAPFLDYCSHISLPRFGGRWVASVSKSGQLDTEGFKHQYDEVSVFCMGNC